MKYLAIIRKKPGYEMIELERGTRHSAFVCAVPKGLGPEDMEYIEVIETPGRNPELVVDWKSKLNKSDVQGVEMKTKWNNQGILSRIKSSVVK